MRRIFIVGLSVLAILAVLAPVAQAQAPAPKVTINGLVDNVTSFTRNLSIVDLNYDRSGDREWYARTRVRPDITAEVGTTKFVLGLEIDYTWGQTGAADNVLQGTPQRFGTTSGADLNTDLLGNIEMKWAYVEFNLPGIPNSRARLGAQPFTTTYKPAVLATGDFAGIHATVGATPAVKINLTYAQTEEASTGVRDGFTRGEDWAGIASVEFTPFKGLDLRPIYAFFHANGNTSGGSRQGRGGVSVAGFANGDVESRHTIGLDTRWKVGPFAIDPTVFYQWGTRERTIGTTQPDQDRSAWFVDVRGGWQSGPLLLEGAVIYTTGNKASERVDNGSTRMEFFEPISTDTSFYAGWAEIFALGIDYFNILYAPASGLDPGVSIGYDKYGLFRLGARASYAVTPAFTLRAAATASWTAEDVDTAGVLAAASGITPSAAQRGREDYLGTEVNLGFQYRFAPNVAFDMVGSYLFAGDGLAHATSPNPEDVQTLVARVRYTF